MHLLRYIHETSCRLLNSKVHEDFDNSWRLLYWADSKTCPPFEYREFEKHCSYSRFAVSASAAVWKGFEASNSFNDFKENNNTLEINIISSNLFSIIFTHRRT